MHGKGRYKFKVIDGILSWKNEEMERFIPVSSEILTRVIMLYEKQFRHGIRIWKEMEKEDSDWQLRDNAPLYQELAKWMDQLRGIFENTDPVREREKWIDDQIHLN